MTETRDDTPNADVPITKEDTLGHSGGSVNKANDTGNRGDNPLMELKSIVLSLDWEITDEVMGEFFREIQRLEERYSNEKILLSFLHLLDSIGKYIKTHKGKAHPHAGRLLSSTYLSLEKVLRSQQLTSVEKKRMLAREVKRYRRLKEQIAFRKTVAVRRKTVEAVDKTTPPIEQQDATTLPFEEGSKPSVKTHGGFQGPADTNEAFAAALEELKQIIYEEFRALREDLKGWRRT